MRDGYAILVRRGGQQSQTGVAYQRTVSTYQAYFNQQPTACSGYIVERQGPGDNTLTGKKAHSRIAAGLYPLATHASPPKPATPHGKYRTIGYAQGGAASAIPRPCLGVESTGARDGILIHPASGFLMSIGCLNPSGPLPDGNANLAWNDSRNRVVGLIDDIRSHLGASMPTTNNQTIPNGWLLIEE